MTRERWEQILFANVPDEVVQDMLNAYVLELEDENAKLRELLQRTWDVFHNASGKEFDAVKQELRELGIEVGG